MTRLLKQQAVSVWLKQDEATQLRRVARSEGLKTEDYLAMLIRQIVVAPDSVSMKLIRVNKDDLPTIENLAKEADEGDEAVSTWLDVCVCIGIDRAKREGGLTIE
jgi:hypothetical protein